MKSCIQWRKSFKYLPEVDEFNIDYKDKEIQLAKFLDIYAQSQRVNIRLPLDYTEHDVELIEAAYEKGYNVAAILPHRAYVDKLKAKNVPFFLELYTSTWDSFIGQIELGVSDIYVTQDLAFELDKLSPIAKENNVQIRCFANIAQSSWEDWKGIKTFFIRPEDVDIYSEYVDVIEFWDAIDNQNVLYDVYFKDKKWDGKLREIIKRLDNDVNNYYILGDEFAKRRIHCGKRCLKDNSRRKCELCDRLIELADSLENSPDYEVYRRRD